MSFKDCILEKINLNEITEGEGKDLLKRYNSLVDDLSQSNSKAKAESIAAAHILEREIEIKALRKRNLQMHVKQSLNVKEEMYRLAQKEVGVLRGNEDLKIMGKTIIPKISDAKKMRLATSRMLEGVHTRYNTVRTQLYSNLNELARHFKGETITMFKTKEGMREVISELIQPGSTNNKMAKEFAGTIKSTLDLSKDRYKNSGGIIVGNIENYAPVSHNRNKIRKVSKEEWINNLMPKLDRERMIDWNTGKPFTDDALYKQMSDDFDGIITNGQSGKKAKLESGDFSTGRKTEISERNIESRFYHFKDAESFLEYNDMFGEGDGGLFGLIFSHIDMMAKDIALLEKLGPKPKAMYEMMEQIQAAEGVDGVGRNLNRAMFDILTGKADMVVSDNPFFTMLDNIKNIQRSAYLGSATLSAIPDTFFNAMTAKMNGLPAMQSMNTFLKGLNLGDSSTRKMAEDMGYIADMVSGGALNASRFADELDGGEVTRWLADFTMRASGLNHWTNATANAVTLTATNQIARMADDKVPWNKLDSVLRDSLESAGLNEKNWNHILKSELLLGDNEKTKFLPSTYIDDNETANKYEDWIQTLRQQSTNEPLLQTKAISTGGKQRGTLGRAVQSTALMFKSYPITVMLTHLGPYMKMARHDGRLAPLASTVAMTSMLGAISMQLREIAKGREPQDMDNKEFWMASMMQGGGLGLLGDFMLKDASRFGRSPVEEFMNVGGPVGGLVSDIWRASKGNFDRGMMGKDSNYARDAFRIFKRNIPAGNIWYTRLAFERMFLDQIEEMLDPKYNKRRRKLEKKFLTESGQRFYWRKGDALPN